jgi:hypothetical protein
LHVSSDATAKRQSVQHAEEPHFQPVGGRRRPAHLQPHGQAGGGGNANAIKNDVKGGINDLTFDKPHNVLNKLCDFCVPTEA